MATRSFRKKKENFVCARCATEVSGDGYTNHCPKCLFSRHVDVFPGDRASICLGMMEPIALRMKDGEERLLHRCVLCGYEKENRVSDADDREAVLLVMRSESDRLFKNSLPGRVP